MHITLRPVASAALIAAGAGLVAISTGSAAADPADVIAQVSSTGQSEITQGLALFNQGDLSDGLEYFINGENNVLIAVPEDSLLAAIENPNEPFDYTFFTAFSNPPFAESFDQLGANLQSLTTIGEGFLTQGINDIASGAVNLGESELVVGSNALTVDMTEQLLFSPLSIAFASVN